MLDHTSRVVVCLLLVAAWATTLRGQEPDGKAETVKLVVDYGDGVEKHFTALAWRPEMTVLDAMQAAQQHPHGIRFEHRGQGETAFVTRIDDVTNEGNGRNWTYRVNDKVASKSCGAFTLKVGDTVLWKFK